MTDLALVYEYFPELLKPDLKKTHAKQWDRFMGAFCDLCLWIHCTRAKHKYGHGIVLFPKWWEKHLLNHHRWHFDLQETLEPYIFTDGHYDYRRKISREWYVTDNFRQRSIQMVSDPRFQTSQFWRYIIEQVLIPEPDQNSVKLKSTVKLEPLANKKASGHLESDIIYLAYLDKLKAGMQLVYTVAANGRLLHPLQNMKREYRAELFKGWYSYDIQACAPTILAQLYNRLEPNEPLPNIQIFLQNREEIREEIAKQTGVESVSIKRVINGMFFGQTIPTDKQARWDISTKKQEENFKFSLINTIGPVATEKLLTNELFYAIVLECQIKIMRRLSRRLRAMTTLSKEGRELVNAAGCKKVMKRWNPRQAVAHTYFGFERQVINVVSEYLGERGINFLLIHDGWLTDKPIETKELKALIVDTIGFSLDFDMKLL